MPVLIVGGGIGGLSLAQALERRGVAYLVLERAPVAREIGAGLTLWPNALLALRRLGLEEAVVAAGAKLRRGVVRTLRGSKLFEADMAALERELGAPSIALHRAALQQILRGGLPDERLRLGFAVRAIEQEGAQACVVGEDGTRIRGSAVIGADGIHSVVRAELHGSEPPRYAGYTCWRTVVDDERGLLEPGLAEEIWGPGARCGAIRIDAERVYAFATVNAPPGGHEADEHAALCARFRGWPGAAPAFLASSDPSRLMRHDIHDRPPRRPWGRGRVTLLGDAAHPMTPNLGQGGCTAIEDALVLADLLAREPDPARAFVAYEERRHARTARLVRKARFLGRVGQERSRLLGLVRNALIRLRSERSMARELRSYVDYRTDDLAR